jgi:phosphoglycolate phosphatase
VLKNFKAIIFDFDYTLADSSRGIIECINYALKNLNLPTANEEVACGTIGLSLPDALVRIAGEEHLCHKDEFIKYFMERADEVMVSGTQLFDGVRETLQSLRENGIKLGIVSTKNRFRIEQTLERDGMEKLFDIIIGGEDVANHKPDPEGVNKVIEILKLEKTDVLYVGDSVTDAETAKRAGVNFCAVLSGVTKRQAFSNYNDCIIIEKLKGILDKQ